jgi:hypothetical protein
MVLVDLVSEDHGPSYSKLDPATKTQNTEYVEAIHDRGIPAAAKRFDTGSDVYKCCVGGADPHYRLRLTTLSQPIYQPRHASKRSGQSGSTCLLRVRT